MNGFTKITTLLGLTAMLATNVVFAASSTMTTPAPGAAHKTAVKGYTKTLKSGKMITVKGYTRKTPMMAAKKGTAVKGYMKTLKSGKKVAVKGYTRKPVAKKTMSAMKPTKK